MTENESLRQVSGHEWHWAEGQRHFGVRHFPATGRLIWSVWTVGNEGPQFEPGMAQEAEDFKASGPPWDHVPQVVLDSLSKLLEPKSGGWFGRKR